MSTQLPGGWPDLDAYLAVRNIRFGPPTVGQTTGGTHVADSYHYRGLARDYGSANSDMPAIIAAFRPLAVAGGPIVELFGPGVAIKNGIDIGFIAGHTDHVHVAIAPGVTLPPMGASGTFDAGVSGGTTSTTVDGGGASNPLTAPLFALGNVASAAVNPATWRRFGMILAASTLVALGVVILKRDLIEAAAETAAIL